MAATPGDLERCAAIAASDLRLACYDALAGRAPDHAPPTAAVDPAKFGLTPAQLHPTPEGPAAIQAHIVSLTADRLGNANAILDNGQTWSLSDEDGRLSAGDEVEIKRAALGAFLMTNAAHHAYHVRRIR
jgi:hypothetical protein